MRAPEDYLELTSSDARAQWQAISVRQTAGSGRQVDFIPVETLTCLAASLLVEHRRYGGSTSHRAEEPVPTLAQLFQRPNSSVLAKMANLDGSRSNGAKHEIEVASRLLSEPGRLAAVYRLVLSAARDVGIGSDRLPDFLLLENDDHELLLLGQEELAESDVETALQDAIELWGVKRPDVDERVTELLLIGAVRVGQHRFASEVLRNHEHRCVFCGLSIRGARGRAQRMLVASHIKPWRTSDSRERLDSRNGLTACPTHDVAFDTGLLMVNGHLNIHVTSHVELAALADPAARAVFGRPPLAERLLLPPKAVEPGAVYLTWHRDNVFQHN